MIQANANFSTTLAKHPLTDHYQALVRLVESLRVKKTIDSMSVGLTSSTIGEGVTTVATNLAISAAATLQRPVLLISAASHGCTAERVLNVPNGDGLAEILAGSPNTTDYIVDTSHYNLSFLPGGSEAILAEVVHDKAAIDDLLAELKKEYDLIIFDLPHAKELTACFNIASQLDTVMLVVESEKTKDQVVCRAKAQLLQAGTNLHGVVLNKRPEHIPNWLYKRI